MTDKIATRRFPIQGEWSAKEWRRVPEATIPWDVAEKAYAVYAAKYGSSQSLERLAGRGGFGRTECRWLLDGAPRDWSGDPAEVTLPGEAPR